MTAFGGSRFRTLVALLSAAASFAGASSLHAQKGKKGTCDVGDDNGSEALGGRLFLSRATDPKMTDTAKKDSTLRSAVGALSGSKFTPTKDFGRDYLMGEALVLLSADPNVPTVGPRSQYGFKDNPTGQIDIVATADTLLGDLATGKPECAELANNMRQQAYVPLTNNAIAQLNAKNYGKADTLAHRALGIYDKSPFVYNVIGGIAVTRIDYPTAKANYLKVIQYSGDDTTYKRLKSSAMYNLAVVSTSIADNTKDPAAKKVESDSAVSAWKAYQQANPSDPNAQAGLTHALQASGDSVAATQLYSDMLNNSSKYTDVQLFQSAIAAAQTRNEVEAVKLFQAGLKTNPYFRDGLYYVSNSEFNNGQIDSLMPMVHRLIAIDPDNPDNYRLLAGAYQIRSRDAKDPKEKRAWADSTLVALKKFQQPTVKLTVNKFVHDGDKIEVGGRIVNLGAASKTFTPKFQFIDVTGNVVGSKDSQPMTVNAKDSATFDVSSSVPGAVSYKYAPLD